jgi:hypothetical protein
MPLAAWLAGRALAGYTAPIMTRASFFYGFFYFGFPAAGGRSRERA